jgi:hypothetical protein
MAMPPRYGRFFISAWMIETQWPSLVGVFANLVVVDCRYRPEMDQYEYVALSSDFSILTPGMQCRTYTAIFEQTLGVADGPPATSFVRWE